MGTGVWVQGVGCSLLVLGREYGKILYRISIGIILSYLLTTSKLGFRVFGENHANWSFMGFCGD